MTGNADGYINEMKQCGLQHARTSMGKTLEARLPCKDIVVMDVWYYCCAYVVHVASVSQCAYNVGVHIVDFPIDSQLM